MTIKFLSVVLFCAVLFISACEDQGNPVTVNTPTPTLTSITPDSGKAGDTITVVGTNFGSSRGSSTVKFGSANAAAYAAWSTTLIKAIVPSGVSSGNTTVAVTVGGKTSGTRTFKSISSVAAVSFTNDIMPLINQYGCKGCHGAGSTFNNFNITTYANLMLGNSSNGPVVTPGNGANSVIVRKLLGTAGFGARMPNGGPLYMSSTEIQKFIDWINQGALNN